MCLGRAIDFHRRVHKYPEEERRPWIFEDPWKFHSRCRMLQTEHHWPLLLGLDHHLCPSFSRLRWDCTHGISKMDLQFVPVTGYKIDRYLGVSNIDFHLLFFGQIEETLCCLMDATNHVVGNPVVLVCEEPTSVSPRPRQPKEGSVSCYLDVKESHLSAGIVDSLSEIPALLNVGAINTRQVNDGNLVAVCCLQGISRLFNHSACRGGRGMCQKCVVLSSYQAKP